MLKNISRVVLSSVVLVLLAVQGCTVTCAADESRDERPNILLILTDDQRFDALNAAGCQQVITPSLDRLAEEGTLFTQATIMGSTRAAVCIPSRAMLLTGNSLFRCQGVIPNDSVTLPQLLSENGYTTFITGKWHNDEDALLRSFKVGKAVFNGGMGSHFKTSVVDIQDGNISDKTVRTEFDSKVFADATIDFLKNNTDDHPFFAFLSFKTPHDPRRVPKKYHQMYDPSEIDLPPNFLPEHPFDNGGLRIRDERLAEFPRDPQEVRQHIADYYAATTATDFHIGRVLEALDELELTEETVIVFAGDNGLAVGQHGLLGKQNLYEHSIRVPLIFRGPGVPRGKRSQSHSQIHDLYPTLAAMAGLQVPSSVDGKDLGPILQGEVQDLRESTFHAYRDIHRAVRTHETKLIEYFVDGNRRTQLFDLQNDPWETNNLADDPAHADLLETMRTELERLSTRYDAPPTNQAE